MPGSHHAAPKHKEDAAGKGKKKGSPGPGRHRTMTEDNNIEKKLKMWTVKAIRHSKDRFGPQPHHNQGIYGVFQHGRQAA